MKRPVHIGTAVAEAIRSIPNVPPSVAEAARLSAIIGRAYEISTYHPVSEWGGLIAESDADIREDVREYLATVYRNRQRDAALAARVEQGADVVLTLKAGGVKEARWA